MSIESYIEKRAGGVSSFQMGWRKAWEICRTVGMTEVEFVELAELSLEYADLSFIGGALKSGLKGDGSAYAEGEFMATLISFVDRSSYTKAQWGRSLSVLLGLLRDGSVQANLIQLLGYIGCSAEFASSETLIMPLEEVVKEMYEKYGLFE